MGIKRDKRTQENEIMPIYALDTETYKFSEVKGVWNPVLDAREFALGCIKSDTGITLFFQTTRLCGNG